MSLSDIAFHFQGMDIHQCKGKIEFIHCTIWAKGGWGWGERSTILDALKSELNYSNRKQFHILLPNLMWSDSIQIFMSNE